MPREKAPTSKRGAAFALLSLLVLVICTSVISQSVILSADAETTTWARTYEVIVGPAAVSSVQQTTNGGYIVVGMEQVIKLDSDGNIEWGKTYGFDAKSIQQTIDGGYIVLGSGQLLKLDSDGNIEWEKWYGNNLLSVEQTSDGGYIVAGFGGADGHDFLVGKLDSDGNIEWEKAYGGTSEDAAFSVQQTSEGGYIVVGGTSSFGTGDLDFLILKLDSDGNIEWEKRYGGADFDVAYSVQQTSDGGYIVAGTTDSFGSGSSDVWLLKLDSDGNIEWEKAYGGTGFDNGSSVQQTSDGGYIVAGTTDSFGTGGFDFWLLKLDSDGNIEWEKAYGGTGYDAAGWDGASPVQQTTDGGYILVGETNSFSDGSPNIWVLKFDSNGNIDHCNVDLIQDSSATVEDTSATTDDTAADVFDGPGTVQPTNLDVEDTSAKINVQCGPDAPPVLDYSLQLFENINDPSDGVVNLNQHLRAVAGTDDSSVDQITFRWINPSAEVAREVTVPASTPEDTFAPDAPGGWTVEADFGNGQVIQKTLNVPFFVLPESPIGAIAMAMASMGALAGFLYLKSRKPIDGI